MKQVKSKNTNRMADETLDDTLRLVTTITHWYWRNDSVREASTQWRTQKISKEEAKFHHNRVMSHINLRGSAEGKTILGGSRGMPPRKFCKITPENMHFCAFWKQVLDNTVFTFFYFYGLRGRPWHSGLPPMYATASTKGIPLRKIHSKLLCANM